MKAKDLQTPFKSGAGCLITSREHERFLLIQRSEFVPTPLTWGLPGGRIDDNELPEDAARREVYEEIGIKLENIPLKLIYTNDVHAPRFRFYTYACVVEKEFDPILNWESQSYAWRSIDDLPNPLHWGVSQLINHDAAGRLLKEFIDSQKK